MIQDERFQSCFILLSCQQFFSSDRVLICVYRAAHPERIPMFAIVSDIHSNLEALDAVLADIARRGITSIYCLGDVVGYGPNPIECLERVMKWELVLKGNHDHAVTFGAEGFGKHAERAV